MDYGKETALSLGRKLREKEIGCVELTKAMLTEIDRLESELNAYTAVLEERALGQAQEIQEQINRGEAPSPLAGVPMAVKDNICTGFAPTTCASAMLEDFTPPYTATAVERLEQAGAVVLGKLNMDEFAMGGSSETSRFGPVKNPWDTGRVPGGSSGGSAAAVASGEAVYTLGSDTGGSIRQPCSFCGVSGIKPTYGTVSRYGLVAFASSLDQIGPIGRTIEDCAAVLSMIQGYDPRDSTSVRESGLELDNAFHGDIRGMKIGLPAEYFGDGLDDDVRGPLLDAAKTLERMGAEIREMHLPVSDYSVAAYYVAACAEASSNLSRYDGVKYGYRSPDAASLEELLVNSRSEGFGMEVKRRIMLGSFVLSAGYYDAYYKKSLQARRLIRQSFDDAFREFDMLLTPTAPTTAYKIGENSADPLKMYLGDVYTVAVNLAGLPAVTIPCGFGGGLPVGMQLIGPAFREADLIKAAHRFQLETDYHLRRPTLAGKGGAQL